MKLQQVKLIYEHWIEIFRNEVKKRNIGLLNKFSFNIELKFILIVL